jgi:hypothetical protein
MTTKSNIYIGNYNDQIMYAWTKKEKNQIGNLKI